MKILMILPRVPFPQRDGGAIAMQQMIKGLKNAGADLILFFLNTSKHFVKPEIIRDQFDSYGEVLYSDINNDVTVSGALLNLGSKKSYHISRFEDETAKKKLQELVVNRDIDIVHFDGLQTTVFLSLIRQHTSAKCVLRQHNIEHLIWERNAQYANGIKGMYLEILANRLKKYEEKTLKEVDAIIPISKVDAVYFNDFDKPVHVTSTGIDVEEECPSDFSRYKVFHLGSLDWLPNQEGIKWFLDTVWPGVYLSDSRYEFYIAGRNMSDQFRSYCEGIKNVIVVGEVEDSKNFMKNHGVLVVPLKSGSGVRIKILEGLSLGIPIVTTAIGVEGIEVEHKKELFIADTEKEFQNSIITITTQSQDIQDNAKRFIRDNFDNNVISQKLLRFYDRIGI